MAKLLTAIKSKFAKVNIKSKYDRPIKQIFTFLIVVLVTGVIFQTIEAGQQPIVPVADNNQVEVKKESKVKQFSLEIASLDIKTPVIANVDGYDKEKYLKALERGVAHFAGTSLPGEGGNIVIFGHSSYYRNQPGNYKEIFAPLPNLETGDLIEIKYNQKTYQYFVDQMETVSPKAVEYLNQTPSEQLTLITCVPPGTTKYRLIVIAKPK